MGMKLLRIVLHNDANRPIFLDVLIDDLLAEAINKYKVTRCEFLIKDHSTFPVPDLSKLTPKSDLNDFHISN